MTNDNEKHAGDILLEFIKQYNFSWKEKLSMKRNADSVKETPAFKNVKAFL